MMICQIVVDVLSSPFASAAIGAIAAIAGGWYGAMKAAELAREADAHRKEQERASVATALSLETLNIRSLITGLGEFPPSGHTALMSPFHDSFPAHLHLFDSEAASVIIFMSQLLSNARWIADEGSEEKRTALFNSQLKMIDGWIDREIVQLLRSGARLEEAMKGLSLEPQTNVSKDP